MWDEQDAAVGITAIGLGRTLRELKRPSEALEQLAMAERVYWHLKGVKRGYARVVLGACLAANGDSAAAQPLVVDGLKTLQILQTGQWPERRFAQATAKALTRAKG